MAGKVGNATLNLFLVMEPQNFEAADTFFREHGEWMKGHPKEGDIALLHYNVSVQDELSNAFDMNSEKTGNRLYVLTEQYATSAGVANHMKIGEEAGFLARFMETVKMSKSHWMFVNGTIRHSLW